MGFFDIGLSDVVSGIGSLIGANQTNQAAQARQDSANQFSAQQYATRYQTTVKDLEAAGLNPMLAYSQGAGTAPTGSAAPVQNALGSAVESYQKSKSISSAAALQKEQVEQAKSQVTLNSAQAAKANEEAKVAQEQAENLRVDRLKRQAEIPQVEASTKAYLGQATASAAQAQQAYKMVENLQSQIEKLKEESKRIKNEGDINAPEAEFARKYPTTHLILKQFLPAISSTVRSLK
jgi:hypothetical protein